MKKIISMTRTALICSSVILLMTAGCNKIKKLADINVDIPYSQQVDVPQADIDHNLPFPPQGLRLTFPQVAVATNSQQYLAQYHTSSSKIVDVNLKSMSIQIATPPDGNFDFLDSVQLYISAINMPEVLVAYQYNIPKGKNSLDFYTITDVNLKNYFLKDTMFFRLNTHINALPPLPGEQLNISTVFHLTANPLD